MSEIVIEQARFRRDDSAVPHLLGRSPGVRDDWLAEAERLIVGFGLRPAGTACPQAVFAKPLAATHVAVVQVTDQEQSHTLYFHFLIVPRPDYEQFLGDPFHLARTFAAEWQQTGPLPTLGRARQPLPPRTLAQVQGVLRRVKAGALKEDEDPEHPEFQHTVDNSESPALLGGVQVLVEGGKLVFERARPDLHLIEGLWTLLPQSTRARLWPATFAFSNALGFDALVVPRVYVADFEGYTAEEQASEYPAGSYELNLQIAAESGNQRQLDALLNRRSGSETFKLGWLLLGVIILLVLSPKLIDVLFPPWYMQREYKAAAAVAMVAPGDPWTAAAVKLYGDSIWGKK